MLSASMSLQSFDKGGDFNSAIHRCRKVLNTGCEGGGQSTEYRWDGGVKLFAGSELKLLLTLPIHFLFFLGTFKVSKCNCAIYLLLVTSVL